MYITFNKREITKKLYKKVR